MNVADVAVFKVIENTKKETWIPTSKSQYLTPSLCGLLFR